MAETKKKVTETEEKALNEGECAQTVSNLEAALEEKDKQLAVCREQLTKCAGLLRAAGRREAALVATVKSLSALVGEFYNGEDES